jgi:hypothetical protein
MFEQGLLAFVTDFLKGAAAQEIGGVMKDMGVTGDTLQNIGQGNFGDAAMGMAKATPEFKAYDIMTSGKPAGDIGRALAPTLLGDRKQNEAYATALQTPAMQMPQMSSPSTPSYATPSMPYMGGGIEEILARQKMGLLR